MRKFIELLPDGTERWEEVEGFSQKLDREIQINDCFGRLVRGELTSDQIERAVTEAKQAPSLSADEVNRIEAASEALVQYQRLSPAEEVESYGMRRSR